MHALKNCTYLVAGYEIGEKGTHHIQGYAEFSACVRPSAMRKVLGPAHFEISRGKPQQASDYCKKDGDFDEWGELSSGQGAREDLRRLRDEVQSGATDLELCENDDTVSAFAKYPRFVDRARIAFGVPFETVLRDNIHVVLFFGPAGSGKSSYARKIAPDAYWKDQSRWWGRYTGQTTVIWDEFYGGCCTPREFNLVCDRYPHTVEYKGGEQPLRATTIIIISNFMPTDWWGTNTRVNVPALTRRFHEICVFPELGTRLTYSGPDCWDKFWVSQTGAGRK